MLTKDAIITKARELGFDDIGFTSAEPFLEQKKYLEDHEADYKWIEKWGLNLMNGIDPKNILDDAQSIIAVVDLYYRESFPKSLTGKFGRCYLDDDRVTKDGLALRIKAFRNFLREHGIDSKVPFNLPHRVAAARAGLGTFGKNCLFYSNNIALKSSWITPFAIVVNKSFEPDAPTVEIGCPPWCRNACIASCPTKALKGNGSIDPKKCVSYLSYLGEGLTPMELREPMGVCVYGCDRCQNVCPRNQPWLSQELTMNERVLKKEKDFDLIALLEMDKKYFESRIWPHMFYMSFADIWRWKMNIARAMGNSLDEKYIPSLVRALANNEDDRVRAMAAWALGRLNTPNAKKELTKAFNNAGGIVRDEIESALKNSGGKFNGNTTSI